MQIDSYIVTVSYNHPDGYKCNDFSVIDIENIDNLDDEKIEHLVHSEITAFIDKYASFDPIFGVYKSSKTGSFVLTYDFKQKR